MGAVEPSHTPVMKFEDVRIISQTILEHGLDGQLRRIMLFDRLGRSPDSGTSRQLIITSNRYGLTTGGYQAEYVNITQVGRDLAVSNLSDRAFRTKVFQYNDRAIRCFS